MKIDGNELAIEQNELDREGRHTEAMAIKREFLKQVRESGDHCPCKQACPHHGNCFECVTLHRGHRDHLPMCMWDMVNERLHKLSRLTEGTLRSYEGGAPLRKLQKAPVPIGTGALPSSVFNLQGSGSWPLSIRARQLQLTKSVSSPAALTAAFQRGDLVNRGDGVDSVHQGRYPRVPGRQCRRRRR